MNRLKKSLFVIVVVAGPLPLRAQVLISEDFEIGPGCVSNLDADIFSVSGGVATVGTTGIRTGCDTPPGGTEYRHALCSTDIAGDFWLEVDVQVAAAQENRAGVVYGWTAPHTYYIFHFNYFQGGPNRVLQLFRFDGTTCFNLLGSAFFPSVLEHWYHVRLEVTGSRHRVFVDGTLQIDALDPNYLGGQVGLSASFNGYGHFDNLLVAQPCDEWYEVPISAQNRPPARGHHAVAYHPDNGIVMFGGACGTRLADTWTWNGDSWSNVSNTGPSSREQHAMIYAPECGGVILFGGAGETGDLRDMWRWDGSTWTQIPETGLWPGTRRAHAIGYDPARGVVVIYGGVGRTDTWEFDCSSSTWQDINCGSRPTTNDCNSVMAFHPSNGCVLFGGCSPVSGETWAWDGACWTEVGTACADRPSPRAWTPLTSDVGRNRVVMFGGNIDNIGGAINDTWEWDGNCWEQIHPVDLAADPPERSRHVVAFHEDRGKTVMFGGFPGQTGCLNDMWEYPAGDSDDDGYCDGVDNCPKNYNPDQADSDGDGIGEVCDLCPRAPGEMQVEGDCIPAVSGWALLVLGLVCASAGTIVLGRQDVVT